MITLARSLLTASLLILGLTGCGEKTTTLTLTGSSTVAPLAAEIGKRFEAEHPGVRVDVQTGGSSRGIRDARDGSAAIGMASRALADDESDLIAHTIARDGVACIVHADHPLAADSQGMDAEQIRDIYNGHIGDWAQILPGSDHGPITVISKAAGRATLAVFCDHFAIDQQSIAADVVIGHNQEAIKATAGNPRAIAFVSIGAAEAEIKVGTPIALVSLEGIRPSSAAVANGTYPCYRPLNLLVDEPATGLTGTFLAYATSAAVTDLVTAQHFVPVETSR